MDTTLATRLPRTITAAAAGLGLLVASLQAAPAEAAPVSRHLGWPATSFTHFTVDAGPVVYSPAHGTIVYSTVCVRSLPPGSTGGKTRISWDPWRVSTAKGTVAPAVFDASHPPQPMFPKSASYRVGECASGWVPYATAKGAVTKVSYANSLANQVSWSMPPQSPNTNLGVQRSFPRFTVKVHQTAVDPGGYWAGARATVCVVSTTGYPTGVPVTQTPWTLSTNRGVFTTRILQEGAPSFGPSFPWSVRLGAGTCATGWIAFALLGYGEDLQVKQVNYRNTLGDAASWKAV